MSTMIVCGPGRDATFVRADGSIEHETKSPPDDLDVANGAYLQYLETGDGCYIDNLSPDEMRAFIRDLADTDRANNNARAGR